MLLSLSLTNISTTSNVDTRRALMSLRASLVVPARYKIFARRYGTRICFTREEFTFDR